MIPNDTKNKKTPDPLEKDIESAVSQYAQDKYGVLVRKFTSPAHKHVPDRIFAKRINDCAMMFMVEFKRRGKKPTAGQVREHARWEENGVPVYIVDDIVEGKALIDSMYEQLESRAW